MSDAILQVEGLKTYFQTDDGTVRAVDDVTFRVDRGKTLGIVGESGSGKSVTSLTAMRLLAETATVAGGRVSFLGRDLIGISERQMRDLRGSEISMIFQEPMTSLNPVYTVGSQVAEVLRLHEDVSRSAAKQRVLELFREVGIPDPPMRYYSYPHQMSGGQKQRVMIAMALACNPQLLIADEPTTALDVTIQAQILDILRKLRDERGMAVIFITHDLGVIAEIADDVVVMFRGKIVEQGTAIEIFGNPQHPYTQALLNCRPRLDTQFKQLPTVEDYLTVETRDDGTVDMTPREMSQQRLQQFMKSSRVRHVHPKSELKQTQHPWREGQLPEDLQPVSEETAPLLEVRDLKVHFPIRRGILLRTVGHVKAVDGISFNVYPGQTLGLVGESGCGKTTTGRALLRLVEPTSGIVNFGGHDITGLSHTGMWKMRRRMQIVFQDPYGSMNPRMTIEASIVEPMRIHKLGRSQQDRRDRAAALLEEVGMSSAHLRRYPHEFSGGQRQRICIARSLAVEPDFLICDESVSALDVSVQAQVLNLLNELQERRNLTYIFISHDLSVVKFMADMMAVMNDGKIVEFGPSESIYADPQQEYTRRLIEATPRDDLDFIRQRHQRRQQQLGNPDPR